MRRGLKSVVLGVISGIILAAATIVGGFGLAWLLGKEAQQALGMLVPMFFAPLALLVGFVAGAVYGWKRG